MRHPTWVEAQWLMARAGWCSRSNAVAISAFERINKEVDITGLRWTLHRMSGATPEQLQRLKAVGGNVNVCSRSFPLAATPTPPNIRHHSALSWTVEFPLGYTWMEDI